MSKKSVSRVPVSALDSIYDKNTHVISVTYEDVVFDVRTDIGFAEVIAIPVRVVDGCFTDSGDYVPQAFEFLIRHEIINAYTNLTLPQNYEKQYPILFGTGLYDVVLQSVNERQVEDIIRSSRELIDYKLAEKTRNIADKLEHAMSRVGSLAMAIEGAVGDALSLLGSSDGVDMQDSDGAEDSSDELVAAVEGDGFGVDLSPKLVK